MNRVVVSARIWYLGIGSSLANNNAQESSPKEGSRGLQRGSRVREGLFVRITTKQKEAAVLTKSWCPIYLSLQRSGSNNMTWDCGELETWKLEAGGDQLEGSLEELYLKTRKEKLKHTALKKSVNSEQTNKEDTQEKLNDQKNPCCQTSLGYMMTKEQFLSKLKAKRIAENWN